MIALPGKAIVLGYNYNVTIVTTSPAFVVGGAYTAQIRQDVDNATILGTITTGDGNIVVVNDRTISLTIPGTLSSAWTAKTVVLDLVRSDVTPKQYAGVKLTFFTERPVTRGI